MVKFYKRTGYIMLKQSDKAVSLFFLLLVLMSACSSNEEHAEKKYFEKYGVVVEEGSTFFHYKIYAQPIEYEKLLEMAKKEYGSITDSVYATHSAVETDNELHLLQNQTLIKTTSWFKEEYRSAVTVYYGNQDELQSIKGMFALDNPYPSIEYGVELSKDDALSIVRVKSNFATKSELRLDSKRKNIVSFLHEEDHPLQAINSIWLHMLLGQLLYKGHENIPRIWVNIKFNNSNLPIQDAFDILLRSFSKSFNLNISFQKEYPWDGYIIKADRLNENFIKTEENTTEPIYSSGGTSAEGGYFFKNAEFNNILTYIIECLKVPCEFENDFQGRYSVVIDHNFLEPETVKEWFEKNGFVFEKKTFVKPTIVIEKDEQVTASNTSQIN